MRLQKGYICSDFLTGCRVCGTLSSFSPTGISRGPPGVATPGVSSFRGSFVNRVLCLIDGFNVYHSLRDCERDTGARVRWLDLRSLCSSLLHALPGDCVIGDVVYFSALAHHIESSRPGTIERHQQYIDVLRASGITVRLGHFKRRRVVCPVCGAARDRYEEKETDVAIASRLLAPESRERFELALIVTGDTDLVPAIQTARSGTAGLAVAVAFPYRRVNRQLRFAADASVRLGRASYLRNQFPAAALGSDGSLVSRPTEWS